MRKSLWLFVIAAACAHSVATLDARASTNMNQVPIFLSALCASHWSPDHSLDVDEAYSHDDSNYGARNSDWMSCLPDTRRFSDLSLPGTHDTMALYGVSSWDYLVDNPGSLEEDLGKTQTMSLINQLSAGIRVLDIRCALDPLYRYGPPVNPDHRRFLIYHGKIFQNASFDTVLQTIGQFLRQHPREAVFMRVKDELTDNLPEEQVIFAETFNSYVQRYGGLFANHTSDNPTLGDVRGKIVVLQDFDTNVPFGIAYKKYLQAQDDSDLGHKGDLYAKWLI